MAEGGGNTATGPFTELLEQYGPRVWETLAANVPRDLRWNWLLFMVAIALAIYLVRKGRGAKGADGRERPSGLLEFLLPRDIYTHVSARVDVWLWVVLGLGALLAGRSRPRYAAAALGVAALYVGAMLISARVARGIVRDAWIARTGEAPRALMVGPVPVNPFRRAIIIDTGDRYFEGSFRWMPARVAFADTATLKNDWLPEVARARGDRRVRGSVSPMLAGIIGGRRA